MLLLSCFACSHSINFCSLGSPCWNTGRPFNEMCLDHRAHNADLERQKNMSAEEKARFKPRPAVPHNPMINAGAIMTCSLLFRDLAVADRFDAIMEVCIMPGTASSTLGHALIAISDTFVFSFTKQNL